MKAAMKASFSAIAASAATTFFGFAALSFMEFGIGAELGIALTKGIVLSFLCVIVLMPALTLLCYKLIDKTQHRPLLPSFENIGGFLSKFRVAAVVLVVLAFVPAFLAQSNTTFSYGMGSPDIAATQSSKDAKYINDKFGQATAVLFLVPDDDISKQKEFSDKLEEMQEVSSVISYASTVGTAIPSEFVAKEARDNFYSGGYSRIIAYADIASEGEESFDVIAQMREVAHSIYGDEALNAGETAVMYDMKVIIDKDNIITTAVAVIAIFTVLLITFKSLLLPIVLVFTIETAIFVNLGVPYFARDTINFIGFLIINTVQLGATVDYAILFADTYKKLRQDMPPKDALFKTAGKTFQSILVSATILSLAGAALWIGSTNEIVTILGLLLFRGTVLSFVLVFTFLPGALLIFDKAIAKTTWRANFYTDKARFRSENHE